MSTARTPSSSVPPVSEGNVRRLRERRYAIVPQMRYYDILARKEWLPYIMVFQPPRIVTPAFTTDEWGFRGTRWRGEPLGRTEYDEWEGSRAALIGSSAAFGIGASSDAFTLAGVFNDRRERMWFNFAGRGFNSTQELLVFLLHLPRDVETVLIFSGANNLVLSYLSRDTSPVYNSFYAQSVFTRGLRSGEVTGVRGALRLLVREVAAKLTGGEGRKSADGAGRYEHVMASFRRDMRMWALLREALGFKLYFVFQPVAAWIDKSLTPEEEEVFAILDRLDPTGAWSDVSAHLVEAKGRYISDVRDTCNQFKVPFLDLNTRPSFKEKRWLFVDRAHLTDDGYRMSASEIVREFPL